MKGERTMSSEDYAEHQVVEKFYSLNFDLIKVSDTKASTLAAISGQSILIVAFLLGNLIFSRAFDISIALIFFISVIFNVSTLIFCVLALTPRKFLKSEQPGRLQPLYSEIIKYTKAEFIKKLKDFVGAPKSEDFERYAEICYNIAYILKKKMRYVSYATFLFVIGMVMLSIAIVSLIFLVSI